MNDPEPIDEGSPEPETRGGNRSEDWTVTPSRVPPAEAQFIADDDLDEDVDQ